MNALTEHERAALAAVVKALAAPDSILAAWRTMDLFAEVGSDGLHLRVGEPSSSAVQVVAERYLRSMRRPFPPLLAALLSGCNGFNIEETTDGRVTTTREPSVRNVWNGLLAVEEVESDETSDGVFSGLRFSAAYAQCSLILVDEGEHEGSVVFDDGETAVVADSLASFLIALSEKGMSVEAAVGGHGT